MGTFDPALQEAVRLRRHRIPDTLNFLYAFHRMYIFVRYRADGAHKIALDLVESEM